MEFTPREMLRPIVMRPSSIDMLRSPAIGWTVQPVWHGSILDVKQVPLAKPCIVESGFAPYPDTEKVVAELVEKVVLRESQGEDEARSPKPACHKVQQDHGRLGVPCSDGRTVTSCYKQIIVL